MKTKIKNWSQNECEPKNADLSDEKGAPVKAIERADTAAPASVHRFALHVFSLKSIQQSTLASRFEADDILPDFQIDRREVRERGDLPNSTGSYLGCIRSYHRG